MRSFLMSFLFSSVIICAGLEATEAPQMKKIKVEITLECEDGPEVQKIIDSLPEENTPSLSYEEWSQNFISQMKNLIELVEKEKTYYSDLGIWVDEMNPKE